MIATSFRRKIAFLALAAVLAAPSIIAAGPRTEVRQPARAVESPSVNLLERVWSFLRNAWSKEGCHIDPDGVCTDQPPVQSDTGCHIDPNGICVP
jgi:hypothetical protein